MPDRLFRGCRAPFYASGGRTITYLLHREDRTGKLQTLIFQVFDPKVLPAIKGNAFTTYRAELLSAPGAELVRRNVKKPGRRADYEGMDDADQRSMKTAVFGGENIRFDPAQGYGMLADRTDLSTDQLLFLEPGWAIGMVVPNEKVGLAPLFRASAAAALARLLSLRAGCT